VTDDTAAQFGALVRLYFRVDAEVEHDPAALGPRLLRLDHETMCAGLVVRKLCGATMFCRWARQVCA
jgi:hypothetical protein